MAGRLILVTVLAATLVSLCGRVFSDFDEPPANDPHDLLRGVGVWIVAVLVAVLNELRIRRQRNSSTED